MTQFSHEKLHVYQLALEFVAWAFEQVHQLSGPNRHAREQLLRSSQSIPLNIAEGNGKASQPDRLRFLSIARGSALESAAALDVLRVTGAKNEAEMADGKAMLVRIVQMLSKMTERNSHFMREEQLEYMVDVEEDEGEPKAERNQEHDYGDDDDYDDDERR